MLRMLDTMMSRARRFRGAVLKLHTVLSVVGLLCWVTVILIVVCRLVSSVLTILVWAPGLAI